MSEWEVVPDEPKPAESEWSVVPEGEKPPETRSFLQRATDKVGESFKGLGNTLVKAGKGYIDLASPVNLNGEFQVPFTKLADPSYRRELERGVSDSVTGGLATKGAQWAEDAANKRFGWKKVLTPEQEEKDVAAAPNVRELGQVGGAALPSPFNYAAGQAAKLIPGTGVLSQAAKGVAGYEAAAVPQAVIAAPEGHRLEAAKEAATNPAGVITSGTIPAVTSFLRKRLDVAAAKAPEIQDKARDRATSDVANDINAAEGPKSRNTDQKKVASVKDRLYKLADENPELRQAFSEPAKEALPKIQAFKDKIAEPLDRLYDAIDAKTGGGLDPHEVVKEFRDMADKARELPSGFDESDRLNKVADRFEEAFITRKQGAPTAEGTAPATQQFSSGNAPPPGVMDQIDALEKLRTNTKPGAAREGIDAQLAKAKAEAGLSGDTSGVPSAVGENNTVPEKYVPIQKTADAKVAELDATHPFSDTTRGYKIPTKVFRHEVTAGLKKADSVMGSIEGTPRYEALQRLYEAGKSIIDKHIDNSGLAPEQITQIRDINNGYFLASRAEEAIKSRGYKEANQPGFKFPMSVKQAVHGGGMAGIATAAALGGPSAVVHALPYIAGTALATHVIPRLAKEANWSLAHGSYGRAVGNLIDVAKKTPRAEFIGAAVRGGLTQQQAASIHDAANKPKPAPQGQPTEGDITL